MKERLAKMILNAIPTDSDCSVECVKAYYKRLGEHILFDGSDIRAFL